jgi:urease subunit gamma
MRTDSTAPLRIETWVSSLTLSRYELKKLVICQVAALARRRRERGLRLRLSPSRSG